MSPAPRGRAPRRFWLPTGRQRPNPIAASLAETENRVQSAGNPGDVGLNEAGSARRNLWRHFARAGWHWVRGGVAESRRIERRDPAPEEAEPWWRDQENRLAIFENLLNWLLANIEIKPHWTALEFGVGELGFATFYKKYVQRMLALDVHDYSSFHPGAEFLLSDGKTIPLEDETVDLVMSHSVLEHVEDLRQSMQEINRILKVGGYAFLTVSPLYYASTGSHVNLPKPLLDWEHLDPSSPYHLLENPTGRAGDYLNKLTSAKILGTVGTVPWDILRYETMMETKAAPDFAVQSGIPLIDLYAQEFRLVAHRRARFASAGPAVVSPHPYPRNNHTIGSP
jgi:SAM-dependent methyltransferase